MSRYIQIQFDNISQEQSDILVACLNEAGFEGFEEQQNQLSAFISETGYDETTVNNIARRMVLVFTKSIIEETNWNQLWESNFEPVIVDDFAAIRADFHEPVQQVVHDIVITPKMSFGTGHHATTYLMIREMRELAVRGKSVFDFGTGTGVLAILAEKSGAARILAIDNDRWSFVNAAENINRNHCVKVELWLSDTPMQDENFDIILANINKNVILENVDKLCKQLLPDACIVLSGLLQADEEEVVSAYERKGLRLIKKEVRANWLLLKLAP